MYSFDLHSPIRLRLDKIQKNEFVYLKITDDLKTDQESLKSLLEELTKRSSRVFFSSESPGTIDGLKDLLRTLPLAHLGVDIAVGRDQQALKKDHTVYSNIDPASLAHFKELRNLYEGSVKVIPEFDLLENHYQLGPTIAHFFNEFDLPFVFIKVQGPPSSDLVLAFKETFESLRIKGIKKKIYFSFNNAHLKEWNIKTYNSFSGLQDVHLDLSNKCTHSCVFCGLWGGEFIDDLKNKSDGKLSSHVVEFMNRQMPTHKALEIIDSLPETVELVQLGGAGDPLTHPDWFKILTYARNRGFSLEVLTNFEYPKMEQIIDLHLLSQGRCFDFWINVSAATAETYKKIRPRQTEQTFKKVLSNIEQVSSLKERDGFGLTITMIHIINVHNYPEAVAMVELAHKLKTRVYLKPLEVHADIHQQYTIPKEQLSSYKEQMKKALARADELGVKVVLRSLIEEAIKEKEVNSALLINETALEKSQFDWGVINGEVPGDLYQKIPCMIGFTYARFEVDGSIKPCCVAPFNFGNMNHSSFEDLWHSLSFYSWRSKFLRINKSRFHLKDKEFGFCKICPHIPMNRESHRLLSLERK